MAWVRAADRLLVFRPGDHITLKAGPEGCHIMLFGGAGAIIRVKRWPHHQDGGNAADHLGDVERFIQLQRCIPPPKAVCPDLLIGVKSMAYVMRYNHFPD